MYTKSSHNSIQSFMKSREKPYTWLWSNQPWIELDWSILEEWYRVKEKYPFPQIFWVEWMLVSIIHDGIRWDWMSFDGM